MNHSKFRLVSKLTIVLMTLSVGVASLATCDDKGRGRGGNNGGHNHGGHDHGDDGHNHGGGQSFLGISPWGLNYGYQDRNFGIQIGPVGGNQGFYDPQPMYVQPNYPPAYYQYDPGYGSYSSPGMSINAGNQPTPANNNNLKSVLNNSTSNPKFAENVVSNPGSRTYYLQSLQLFSSGDYKNASRVALHAMLEDPANGQLKLYISQCQLANGDYEAAAAHLYDGLSRLEQEQWGGVVENFRQFYKQNDYVPQFDKLVKFAQENPEAAYAYSLRGYHYYYLGHPEAAEKQWTKALEIDPKEPLALKLKVLTDGATPPADPTLAAPLPSPNN